MNPNKYERKKIRKIKSKEQITWEEKKKKFIKNLNQLCLKQMNL